ncbi:MAG: OmpA family protein [Microbacterium sp.]
MNTIDIARSLRRAAAGSVALVVAACGLSACAAPGPVAPDDIVVVMAPTMNNPGISGGEIDQVMDAWDAEGDRLRIVVASGHPTVALDVSMPQLPGRSDDRKGMLRTLRTQVRGQILGLVAESPEVDLSEAIALGASAFRPEAHRVLWVLASGIQTTGAMDMTGGRLYAESADLVTHVEQSSGLAKLDGVTVIMPRIGVVVAPQQMNEVARGRLDAHWSEYFARAGVSDVRLTPQRLAETPQRADALPQVTPVPVEAPAPIAVAGCIQRLSDASIGFAVGSSELPAQAEGLIRSVYDALAGCTGDFTVEGSASSEGVGNDALALARAESARLMLSEISGIPVDQIAIRGWGDAWPCRIPDIASDGSLILDAAMANRVVVITRGETGC